VDSDVLDEALDYLADRGPIFRGFLTNHGPMAAEALIRLEREREVMPFLARYRLFLEDRPALNGRVDPQRWQDMLGRRDQFAAWQQFFENELAEHPWRDVLDTWTYRLAPGLWGELLHGLIRTGHAARALAARETPLRFRELAEGLALWASWYETLPETPGSAGRLSPGAAFACLPVLPRDQQGIRPLMDDPHAVPGFEAAAGLLDVEEPLASLPELTATYAALYVANSGLPGNNPIYLIHAVTGPSAVRLLAPHVSDGTTRSLLRYAWQSAAKINASWSFDRSLAPVESPLFRREDVIDQAVASRDEHAMKLVEACLREHALNPQPAYLAAASDVVIRLRN